MTDDALIQMTDVAVGHDTTRVLTGVTWTIRRGEAWYVIGRNGSGKSTLLATALGRLPVIAGQVQRRSGLITGSVPQQCGLVTELPVTVREFVGLGLFTGPRAHRQQWVDAALTKCGLTTLADNQVWKTSGGERRRAMIARALALQPDLLALDEPSAGLDATSERDLATLISRLRADGVTIIYITHDAQLAATQASHLLMITDGSVRDVEPRTLLSQQPVGISYATAAP